MLLSSLDLGSRALLSSKLVGARFPLYRSQILQENTRWKGHEFLRLCEKRDVEKTFHMMDVLITQHARWAARRIKRALFGQALIDFSTAPWSRI